MLNKLSNGEKITKNGALQREIWRSEISLAARVFGKNPSKRLKINYKWGLPHLRLLARGGAETHPELRLASSFLRCNCNNLFYFNKFFNNFYGNKK